jgi:hypothetical protein
VDFGANYKTGASASGYGASLSAETGVSWSLRGGPDMTFEAKGTWQDQTIFSASLPPSPPPVPKP